MIAYICQIIDIIAKFYLMKIYDVLIPCETPFGELNPHMYIIRNIDVRNGILTLESLISREFLEVEIDGVISVNGRDYKSLEDNFPKTSWYKKMRGDFYSAQRLLIYSAVSSMFGTIMVLMSEYSASAFSFCIVGLIVLVFAIFITKDYGKQFRT